MIRLHMSMQYGENLPANLHVVLTAARIKQPTANEHVHMNLYT